MIRDEIIDKFKHVPYGLEVVCVGTTQAHFAIDFSNFSINGFNMACYLNPIRFSGLLLEKYKNYISKNATILITVQYPIFCIDNFKHFGRSNKQQYAKIMLFKNPYCSYIEQLMQHIMPLQKNSQYELLKYANFLEERNKNRNHFKPWEIKSQCVNLISNGWEKEIGIEGYVMNGHILEDVKMSHVMESVVQETANVVELCKLYGWRPIILGLPYSRALCNYVPTSFKEKCFYNNIQKIVNETKCEFWDYSEDERLTDIHNYIDIWFMNKVGREIFTRILLEKIGVER